MYENLNYKAAGVCYNNIANIQFKNGKYDLARDNFLQAIKKCELCMKGIFNRDKKDNDELSKMQRHQF